MNLSNYPILMSQWHTTKNREPEPTLGVSGRSLVWWQCDKGHEWETRLVNRFKADKTITACPICSGRKFVKGVNDLTVTNPDLAQEWVRTVEDITDVSSPNDVNRASQVKVLWRHVTSENITHEWEATVKSRASSGQGCSICAGKLISPGVNDLASQHPFIATKWHPLKNKGILPHQVAPRSSKKYWWLGECGHEWETRVSVMTDPRSDAGGCPVCDGKQVLPGVNDLASHPNSEVLAFWNYSKNTILPNEITRVSPRKVWWQCDKDHEWQATVASVANDGTRCPTCAGRIVIPKMTDFGTLNPSLLEEWDDEKNRDNPITLGSGTHKAAWWKCDKGHEWETSIRNRAGYSGRLGTKCPTCSNRIVLVGFNDLATTHPKLVSQWSSDNLKKPTDITAGSGMKVSWKCDKGHETCQSVVSRATWGCPDCISNGVSKQEKEIYDFVTSLGYNAISGDRKVLSGKELDIYIPEKQVAIEFNGLYWHSEAKGKGKWYHHNKWKACQDKGIQLIQLWEDDWRRNPDLVKRMLAHKLGSSYSESVFARKTVAREVTSSQAAVFLDENHIQGSVDGSIRVGLFIGVELVAVMILKNEPSSHKKALSLLRYATAKNVVGGFTKLLTHVKNIYPTVEEVITFSDNSVSDGGLYESNGFRDAKHLPPDYMYIVGNKRYHKFGYRLVRFRNDPALQYVDGLTERELAELNGLVRVWDSGKVKWVKSF